MALAILPFGPLLSDDVKLGEGDLGGKEERLVESDTEKRSSHVHVSEFEDWAQDHWHDYRLIRPDHTLRDETVKVRWQKHRQGRYERFELVVRTEKKQEILRRDIVEVGRHAARAWCTKFKDEADAYQIGKAKSSTVKVEGKTLVDWTMIYSCEFTGVCPGGNC